MKKKLQLKPKVAPSIKLTTTLLYIGGGIIIATLIGTLLFFQLNLGNNTDAHAAGTFISRASGSWTNAATWQGGNLPGTDLGGADITIRANHSVSYVGNLTGNNQAMLTIEANATLTITGDFILMNSLVLNNFGTLIITGSLIAKNNSSVVINGGGTIRVGNNIDLGNNAEFTVNGRLTVEGNVSLGSNSSFAGTGNVGIVGTGCNRWTGSTTCQSGLQIMPVKLLSFKAHDEGGSVAITWSTAAEQNNDYFTLQKSTDGVSYRDLDIKKGNGTKNTISYYSLNDNQPDASRLYYRLLQTDLDGTTETFAPIFVDIKPKANELSVYPNPMAGRTVTVQLPNAEAGLIQCIDGRGKVILSHSLDGSSATVDLEFDNDLLAGLYFLNYKSNNGVVKQIKLIKK